MSLAQWRYRVPLLLRSLFRRHDVDRELDDELRFHIEQQTALNIAAGMPPETALKAARRSFGNVDARKEECHDHWVVATIDRVRRDLRLAIHRLGKEPRFTAGVVALLALGIGANVAAFSIVNGVLLKPLAYANPDRLMVVREYIPERDSTGRSVNALHFREWQACECFDDIALAEYPMQATLTGEGDPIRIPALRVTANTFAVLGIRPQLGRTFVEEDAEPGNATNIVISDRLWRNQLGADPEVLGHTLTIDAEKYTVVGVLAPDFRFYPMRNARVDAYAAWPLEVQPWWHWTNNYSYTATGRLADGVTPQAALDELNAIQAVIADEQFLGDAASLSLEARLFPLRDWVTAASRNGLYLLLAAVAVALIVACLNIANLMLVRATARVRETGIRSALGATRVTIFRTVFVEGTVLATLGAMIGIALAIVALRLFASAAPASLPRVDDVGLDWTALLIAVGLTVTATLVFGLVPAFRLTRVDPERALEASARSDARFGGSMHGRQTLVSVEVGLSVVLMVIAGLLLASFVRLGEVERGFDAANVLTADVNLPAARYSDQASRLNFWNGLRAELLEAPGVSAAGVTSVVPLRGNFFGSTALREGEQPPDAEHPGVQYRFVTEGYFEAMGIPVVRGRRLTRDDYGGLAAVVSQQTANLLWGDESPIGRRFHWNQPELLFEVVGVVPDVHSLNLETDPTPIVYRPITGAGDGFSVVTFGTVSLRLDGGASIGVSALRSALAQLDPDIAVSNVQTMEQIEKASVAERRLQLFLVGAFGLASLVIAVLGIYSVLAYATSTRRHELALRMTLGADRRNVLALVMSQGLKPVLIGIGLGLVASIAVGQLLEALFFEVAPTDARTLMTVVVVTLAAAVLASLLPARRAASAPLMTAIRDQ